MKLVKVQPFNGFENMVRRMNHMMNDLDLGGTTIDRSNFFDSPVLTPRVDVAEDKSNFYINVELAGLSKDDVKVAVSENHVLTISGEKKQEEKTEDKNFHRIERRYGAFKRSFTLPQDVNDDMIAARFENGVLMLTIPKQEPQKPSVKEISVQ